FFIDGIGCFVVSLKISPLKKFPESPKNVATKFYLFTRNGSLNHAETLNVDDALMIPADGNSLQTLLDSDFDPQKPLKMIIHGFQGSGIERGALVGIDSLLDLEDVNIITVDWEKGASGPSYAQAVANTELVGRQVGLLLMDMLSLGIKPAEIHMIGFSLGAHIAACASYLLQTRLLVKVGRITGLDPASPIFRNHLLVESSRKLDKDDADFVDVIHTDGSPVWTDGFGLLQPLGHVDFFPNGGREQPGCRDGKASVLVSHFAWRLFVESLKQKPGGCQFMAYPCQAGLPSFLQGNCYPALQKCTEGDGICGMMGINSLKTTGRGPLYLVTRDSSPYCVYISEKTQNTRGILHMVLSHKNSTTNFRINCEFMDVVQGGRLMWGLAAAEFGTIGPHTTPTMQATLGYQSFTSPVAESEEHNETSLSSKVYLDKLSISDVHGNSWNYCGKNTLLEDKNQTYINEVTILLTMSPCSP
ncbi:hypothetical protein C0J52_01899, partial [Blattella germanica]